ncbi:MAG: acetolactate synthase large subunit [Deltaproteobacteria bacterium]|nr:acetolactate synthase large subunit [Deltaproteobacteria bacterium]
MNGAEILLKTAAQAGVEVCFTNPGTTELPLVAAFDIVPGIRPVLGLFEGCCAGAADGYGRMTGKPAMTLFHLGPGLGNAVANLHNARRARTPVFNVIGDHASWHRGADAPLTMDIESLSATVSGWTRMVRSTDAVSQDTADALQAALLGMGATLILPQNYQWADIPDPHIAPVTTNPAEVDDHGIDTAAVALKKGKKCLLLLGGDALREKGLQHAARVSAAVGCDLLSETFPAHMERGRGLPAVARLPYVPEFAIQQLSAFDTIILAGAKKPVAFFGYRGGTSQLTNDTQQIFTLSESMGNAALALEHLAEAVKAPPHRGGQADNAGTPVLPQGTLDAKKASLVLAALQPENAIIVDESITSAVGYYKYTATAPRFSLLALTGGAIGMGMSCSIGAALACTDRPVIDFQADGSAMYTIQSLWTQAREGLDITTLICANRSYKILEAEFNRAESRLPGKQARSLMDLGHPLTDWVKISQGFGVPACAVNTAEELAEALTRALAETGPNLIQVNL